LNCCALEGLCTKQDIHADEEPFRLGSAVSIFCNVSSWFSWFDILLNSTKNISTLTAIYNRDFKRATVECARGIDARDRRRPVSPRSQCVRASKRAIRRARLVGALSKRALAARLPGRAHAVSMCACSTAARLPARMRARARPAREHP